MHFHKEFLAFQADIGTIGAQCSLYSSSGSLHQHLEANWHSMKRWFWLSCFCFHVSHQWGDDSILITFFTVSLSRGVDSTTGPLKLAVVSLLCFLFPLDKSLVWSINFLIIFLWERVIVDVVCHQLSALIIWTIQEREKGCCTYGMASVVSFPSHPMCCRLPWLFNWMIRKVVVLGALSL